MVKKHSKKGQMQNMKTCRHTSCGFNKHKKTCHGLVAFYDIRQVNGAPYSTLPEPSTVHTQFTPLAELDRLHTWYCHWY